MASRSPTEALSVYKSVRHTTYSHKNYIDVATGIYDIDCNGFVGFVLAEIAQEHFHMITPEPNHTLPRAFIYQRYFANLSTGGTGGWIQVLRLADARVGDIVAWALTAAPDRGKNTGHVMIVADDPVDLGDNTLSVRVYDSSDVIHYDDTRGRGGDSPPTGVGVGTVRLRVGPCWKSDGVPVWEG